MASTQQQKFLLNAIEMNGIEVGCNDNGHITAARGLTDGKTEMDDVVDLAGECGLKPVNVITDTQSEETRVVFSGGESA